jgi:hypothetical protein
MGLKQKIRRKKQKSKGCAINPDCRKNFEAIRVLNSFGANSGKISPYKEKKIW